MSQKLNRGQYKLSQLFAGITLAAIVLTFLRRPISCIEAPNMVHGTIHGFVAPWTWILWFFSVDINFGHDWADCNGWSVLPGIISVIIQIMCLLIFGFSMFSLSYYTFKGELPPEPNKPKWSDW